MEGYYIKESSKSEVEVRKGTLKISVTNLPEFQKLVKKAKIEADQLQQTINQLSNFEINIDFSNL